MERARRRTKGGAAARDGRRSSGVGGGHGGAGGCLLLLRSSMQSRPFLPLPSALPCVPARRLSLSLTPPPRRCRSPPALHVLAHSNPIPSRLSPSSCPLSFVRFVSPAMTTSTLLGTVVRQRGACMDRTRLLAFRSFVRSSMPRGRPGLVSVGVFLHQRYLLTSSPVYKRPGLYYCMHRDRTTPRYLPTPTTGQSMRGWRGSDFTPKAMPPASFAPACLRLGWVRSTS